MNRFPPFQTYGRMLAFLAVIALLQGAGLAQTERLHPRRVAVFGSSVANGSGDEFNSGGYTGRLRQILAARGWELLNQSRGGDTTPRLARRFDPQGAPDASTRYLLPARPSYVVFSLSLANEGIFEAQTKAEKDAVYQQYVDGMKDLIERARQNDIVPVVTLAYPRGVYTPTEYEYIRRVNLLQSSWDVPTVNFLGAIDAGNGRWAEGFSFDDKHPNAAGHREMAYAFVPTLFEALEQGKPTPVKPAVDAGFARVARGVAPLTFSPPDAMHSFALSFVVRARGDGTVAAISGSKLVARNETKHVEFRQSLVEFESVSLSTNGPFTAGMGIQNGTWVYTSADGSTVESGVEADEGWHHIVLSHYTARGQTLIFVDGALKGTANERLEATRFVLGGPGSAEDGTGPPRADYKDLFLFRAALNADEVAALNQGRVLQASLEIYAPLADSEFPAQAMVENRAQSLSALQVGSDTIVHFEEATGPTHP